MKNASVTPVAGQQFVSVKCNGDWTLAVVSDDDETVEWARLSTTSGVGNKSNVILSYDGNDEQTSRTLKIVLDNGAKGFLPKPHRIPAIAAEIRRILDGR